MSSRGDATDPRFSGPSSGFAGDCLVFPGERKTAHGAIIADDGVPFERKYQGCGVGPEGGGRVSAGAKIPQ
jgi:hypothetical protein